MRSTHRHKKDCSEGRSYFFIFTVPEEQEALEDLHALQSTQGSTKPDEQAEREQRGGDFTVVFEGRNGPGKVSKWNKFRIG